MDSEAGRLQSLIHRYFNQPDPTCSPRSIRRREAADEPLAGPGLARSPDRQPAQALIEITERFWPASTICATCASTISSIYDSRRAAPRPRHGRPLRDHRVRRSPGRRLADPALARQIARSVQRRRCSRRTPIIFRSRTDAGDEAKRNVELIERTAPVMLDLAETDLQRQRPAGAARPRALDPPRPRPSDRAFHHPGAPPARGDRRQRRRDGRRSPRSSRRRSGERERAGAETLRPRPADVTPRSRSSPSLFVSPRHRSWALPCRAASAIRWSELRHGDACDRARATTSAGSQGLDARDEIGEMARAVEVFRENAIAKREAEDDAARLQGARRNGACRSARHAAEPDRGREARRARRPRRRRRARGQQSGRHQPHGRVEPGAALRQLRGARSESGALRRSRLDEFVAGSRDAAKQLVANLIRAADLIQSFKQVAVDRSHADRRMFDLRESTEQIVASLRPGLKQSPICA